MGSKILDILFKGILFFVGFLILLIILNLFAAETQISIFSEFVKFFNDNLVLLAWITLVIVIGEIFGLFKIPFNIPAPIFDAVGGVLIVVFVSNLFMLLIRLSSVNLDIPYNLISIFIAVLVFLIVLIAGYYKIFKNYLPLVFRKTDKKENKERSRTKERAQSEDDDEEDKEEEDKRSLNFMDENNKQEKSKSKKSEKQRSKKKKERFY